MGNGAGTIMGFAFCYLMARGIYEILRDMVQTYRSEKKRAQR